MNNPLRPLEAEILDVRQETYDIATYTLAFRDRAVQDGYTFLPGQFNMIGIPGVGEAAISLSSNPQQRDSLQHTIRAVGSVTRAMAGLGVGDMVGLRGPYGHPWPLQEAVGNHVLVVAGGLGLAPLRPVIEHVLSAAGDFLSLTILYGARTPLDLAFTADLDRWQAAHGTRLLLTVDRTADRPWDHAVGVVPVLFQQVDLPPSSTVALVCGPEVMMKFVVLELRKRGYVPPRIFLSLERRMTCGTAQCGHCFLGPKFVCKDGPVFRYTDIGGLWGKGV